MSDAGNAARDDAAPGASAFAWPQPTVVPAWKWRVWLSPSTWLISILAFAVFVVVCAAGVVAAIFALTAIERLGLAGAASFAANAAAVLAAVALIALALRDVARRAARAMASSFVSHIPQTEPARGFMLAELAENGPPRDSWGAWHVRRWLERVREGRPTRAFVSRHLAERTSRYDRTDRPVEPEAVGGGVGRGDVALLVVCGTMGAGYCWLNGWFNFITLVCATAMVGAVVRMVRRRSMFAPVVAGQGWVQHGAARWTVEDSVMVATGLVNARVAIVGPHGVLSMRLRTARHGDLETLWVRWMHPTPRLDQTAFDA